MYTYVAFYLFCFYNKYKLLLNFAHVAVLSAPINTREVLYVFNTSEDPSTAHCPKHVFKRRA